MILNMLADGLFSLLSLFYSERQQYNKILQNIKPGEAGGGWEGSPTPSPLFDLSVKSKQKWFSGSWVLNSRGGGVLPYITYTDMCRPTGS